GTLSTWIVAAKGSAFHATALLWPPTTTTTAPGKPTAVIATVGSASGTVVVVWDAPLKSGSKPVSSYTVTSSPGGITATTNGTFATVSGLTPTTSYTFTVTATNSVGTSSASEASNAVVAP
ncbi:MAG TPA: fibronectin type III domain-containing protein, partial [Candidatus Paceibacterota bacterium]|nr:fibronectin type III domain-containing protein [Candidatus Paceibacterota bacterium]